MLLLTWLTSWWAALFSLFFMKANILAGDSGGHISNKTRQPGQKKSTSQFGPPRLSEKGRFQRKIDLTLCWDWFRWRHYGFPREVVDNRLDSREPWSMNQVLHNNTAVSVFLRLILGVVVDLCAAANIGKIPWLKFPFPQPVPHRRINTSLSLVFPQQLVIFHSFLMQLVARIKTIDVSGPSWFYMVLLAVDQNMGVRYSWWIQEPSLSRNASMPPARNKRILDERAPWIPKAEVLLRTWYGRDGQCFCFIPRTTSLSLIEIAFLCWFPWRSELCPLVYFKVTKRLVACGNPILSVRPFSLHFRF